MAKVRHSQLVDYMSGKLGNSVIFPAPSKMFSYTRNYVYPALTVNNHEKGFIMQNLALVWSEADPAYVSDGAIYASMYFQAFKNQPELGAPVNNSFGLFVKMMWAWYHDDPEHVDLTTVTIADINTLDAQVRTWGKAVDNGYLPSPGDTSGLDNDIMGT